MLALFIALTLAAALLVWAELSPRRAAAAPVPVPAAGHTVPEFPGTYVTETASGDDLPRIAGFRSGDVIELEIIGRTPSAIRFEQAGRDARVLLDGEAALVLEAVTAAELTPGILRFRTAATA